MIKKYITRVSLAEDINNPFIWFSELPCNSREIVKLINMDSSKSVWCEVVKASDNFIERYNCNERTFNVEKKTPFLVVNQWYRNNLGLVKNEQSNIKISHTSTPKLLKQFLASYDHPDNTVRLAVILAFISITLGIIGLFLGIISLCK